MTLNVCDVKGPWKSTHGLEYLKQNMTLNIGNPNLRLDVFDKNLWEPLQSMPAHAIPVRAPTKHACSRHTCESPYKACLLTPYLWEPLQSMPAHTIPSLSLRTLRLKRSLALVDKCELSVSTSIFNSPLVVIFYSNVIYWLIRQLFV